MLVRSESGNKGLLFTNPALSQPGWKPKVSCKFSVARGKVSFLPLYYAFKNVSLARLWSFLKCKKIKMFKKLETKFPFTSVL